MTLLLVLFSLPAILVCVLGVFLTMPSSEQWWLPDPFAGQMRFLLWLATLWFAGCAVAVTLWP